MRFEEPINGSVARFPELRAYAPRETVPYASHEEIADGIARGRRLHARSCRRAAHTAIAKPVLAGVRHARRAVAAAVAKVQKDRAFRSTVRVLDALEDSQLRDIGIDRSHILHVARGLAYAEPRKAPTSASEREPAQTQETIEHARAA